MNLPSVLSLYFDLRWAGIPPGGVACVVLVVNFLVEGVTGKSSTTSSGGGANCDSISNLTTGFEVDLPDDGRRPIDTRLGRDGLGVVVVVVVAIGWFFCLSSSSS